MADDAFRSEPGPGPALDAQRLKVEALGEPGQRRFRLLALVEGVTFVVWMEKQQLQALGLALEQILDQLPDEGPILDGGNLPLEFDAETSHQFRVGRMELGYDERRDRLVIIAHDLAGEDGHPSFSCRLTRGQAREISADASVVVSAGRPRCTMCGAPMGPGPHVCPEQNGHLPLSLEEILGDGDDDEDDLGDSSPGI
jgi:uncharacterized repeat protein (TIGR03847 family)